MKMLTSVRRPRTVKVDFNGTFVKRIMSFRGRCTRSQLFRTRVQELKNLCLMNDDFSFSVRILLMIRKKDKLCRSHRALCIRHSCKELILLGNTMEMRFFEVV